MSISSEEITTSATLEQFRVQFNNLVSDVQGLESGTASFSNIEVKAYDGLTINFAKSIEARVIVRGLRSPADGQYEFELASMNKRLADDIETVFLSSGDQNAFISSSLIRQIAQEGGNISDFVHPAVQNALAEAYKK